MRHKVECVYDQLRAAPASSSQINNPPTPASNDVANEGSPRIAPPLLAEETTERRHIELKLLHCFLLEILPRMPGAYEPVVRHIWSTAVPALAFAHDPLFHSIMALSILYLTRMGRIDIISTRQPLSYRAEYVKSTLHEHRKSLNSLSKQNADAASFTCAVLAIDSFATMRERTLQPYTPPIQWLQMCKGTFYISRLAAQLLEDEPEANIKKISDSTLKLMEPATVFCEANRNRFPYLLIQSESCSNVTEEDEEAYVAAISYIGAVLAAKEAGEHIEVLCRKLLIVPVLFQSRFIEAVTRQEPRALAILAHYFGLASLCRSFWWIGSIPQEEIVGISSHLGTNWSHLLDWPLRIINQY